MWSIRTKEVELIFIVFLFPGQSLYVTKSAAYLRGDVKMKKGGIFLGRCAQQSRGPPTLPCSCGQPTTFWNSFIILLIWKNNCSYRKWKFFQLYFWVFIQKISLKAYLWQLIDSFFCVFTRFGGFWIEKQKVVFFGPKVVVRC